MNVTVGLDAVRKRIPRSDEVPLQSQDGLAMSLLEMDPSHIMDDDHGAGRALQNSGDVVGAKCCPCCTHTASDDDPGVDQPNEVADRVKIVFFGELCIYCFFLHLLIYDWHSRQGRCDSSPLAVCRVVGICGHGHGHDTMFCGPGVGIHHVQRGFARGNNYINMFPLFHILRVGLLDFTLEVFGCSSSSPSSFSTLNIEISV